MRRPSSAWCLVVIFCWFLLFQVSRYVEAINALGADVMGGMSRRRPGRRRPGYRSTCFGLLKLTPKLKTGTRTESKTEASTEAKTKDKTKATTKAKAKAKTKCAILSSKTKA